MAHFPNEELPPVPLALVEWLERLYPDRLPERDYDLRSVDQAVGRAEIIRLLRRVHEEQLPSLS